MAFFRKRFCACLMCAMWVSNPLLAQEEVSEKEKRLAEARQAATNAWSRCQADYQLGIFYYEQTRYAEAKPLLISAANTGHDHSVEARALRALVEMCEKEKDFTTSVSYLERLATPPPQAKKPERIAPDRNNSLRQDARSKLVAHYLEQKDFAKARTWLKRWSPSGDCGTCYEAMAANRLWKIMLCELHLNNHAEAAQIAWQALGDCWPHWSQNMSLLLYDLYRTAGQTNDLMRLLEQHEAKHMERALAQSPRLNATMYFKEVSPYRALKDLHRVYQLEEKKDTQALVQILQNRGDTDDWFLTPPWRNRVAAQALLRCANPTTQAVLMETAAQWLRMHPVQSYAEGWPQPPRASLPKEVPFKVGPR